jgi:hypothetical protein
MRVTMGGPEKTGATVSAGCQGNPDSGSKTSASQVGAEPLGAGVSDSPAKLLENSQTLPDLAGRIETALYPALSGQTDRNANEPLAKEQGASETLARPLETDLADDGRVGSSEPVRSVRLQILGENDQRVDVRLVEQAGSLALSVRSSDGVLTRSLQDRLPELHDSLAEQHYQSEAWLPQGALNMASSGPHDSNSGQQDSNQSDPSGSGSNKQFSDSRSSSGHAGQQQNGRQNKAPEWYRQLTAFGDDLGPRGFRTGASGMALQK